MTGNNYYCAGDRCRCTTHHVCVRMDDRTYYYCVRCGRRLELRVERREQPVAGDWDELG